MISVHTSRGEKRRENPRTLVGFSSPRAIRPRSRTLSNAERVVAWSVEDGIRSVVSGEDGGVVWWRFGGGVLVVASCVGPK